MTLGTNAHTYAIRKIEGTYKRETNLGQDRPLSHSLSSQGIPGYTAPSSSAKAAGGNEGSADGSARTESRHGSATNNYWTDAHAARR